MICVAHKRAAWAAMLLLGIIPALAPAARADVSALNRFEAWVEDSLRAAAYLDRLDLQYIGGPWLIGARLEFDEESRWDPERGTELIRRYAEYGDGTLTLRGGTLYTTFGRGFLLRAMEDEDVRVDRDIDGFYGAVNWRSLRGQAVVGRPRNDESRRRDDVVSGLDGDLQLGSQLAVGGGYTRLDAVGEEDDPDLGRPIEEIGAGRLEWTYRAFDLYLEGAHRYIHGEPNPRGGWTGTDAKDGRAWYGALTFGVPGYVALLEGKDYLRFDAPYSTPPPVNVDGVPLNNGYDERGLGVQITASPVSSLTFDGSGSWAEAREGDAERGAARALLRKDWWGKGALQIGGEWVLEKRLEGHDEREYSGPSLEAVYYLTPEMSLDLKAHVYARSDSLQGWRDDYTEATAEVTLSQSAARSATLAVTHATTPLREFDGEDLWTLLILNMTINYNHEITVKIGQERGGITCSGGICHYEPPFSGVRLELVSRL